MSERGVFAVDRGIWEHDLLMDSDPFSRREAWLWLVSEAAWKPHRRRIIGRSIELDRGQLVGSLRFIASKWRWSEPRVRRFLTALKLENMIDAQTDAGVSIITICKYDEYQRVSLPTDAKDKTSDDAGATQERRKVEDKEYREETNAAPNGALPLKSEEAELFEKGKKVLGSGAGGLIVKLLKSKKGSVALARAAIEQASEKENPREYIGRILSGPARAGPALMENGQPYPDGII